LLKIIHGGGGNPLIINQIQSSIQTLDESSFARIESIPETPENEKYLADLGIDLKSASAGYLPSGAKVLVLAYKKNGNTYTFHKEHVFEVGKDSDFRLDGGQNYTLIFVSTGSKYIKTYNINNINNAYFSFDRTTEEGQYLYERIDNVITSESEIKMNVKLKKRTVGVRIVLDASKIIGGHTGRKITSIKNAKITYRTLPITNDLRFKCDSFSRYGDNYHTKEKKLNFTGTDQIKTSELIEDLMYLGNNTQVKFTAEVEIEGFTKGNIEYELKNINIGHKKTYNLKFQSCGAYLGPNETDWGQFMCHNLGADYSLDPFTPSANIHGDKYQWGHQNPIVKQKDDIYTGSFPNWNREEKKIKHWNMVNICPKRYRIPTKTEWESVLKYNNTFEWVGNWGSLTLKRADVGIKIGDNLFLPAAGAVDQWGNANYRGWLIQDSAYASYWSSGNFIYDTQLKYNVGFALSVTNYFEENLMSWSTRKHVLTAMPIRCIKYE